MVKTILVADDDADIRDFLKKLLIENNYHVLEAADGAQALEIIEKTLPNLVLLDLNLPKVSGETICVKIKSEYPQIVVIALTAKAGTDDVVHGLQIGADDYITKPFVAEELMARIETRLKTTEEKDTLSEEQNPINEKGLKAKKVVFRESGILVVLRLIFTEFVFALIIFLMVMVFSALSPYFQTMTIPSFYILLFTILLILNLLAAVLIVLRWYFAYSEVTQDSITLHSGILYKKEQKYICSFIETITMHQSFLGMIFNYGTLELTDTPLKEKIYLMNITNPKKYNELIKKIFSDKPKTASPPPPTS